MLVISANHVNLIENIERLKLSVDRILPLHGRVVPLADLYRRISGTRCTVPNAGGVPTRITPLGELADSTSMA